MSNGTIKPDSATIARALDVIAESPGLQVKQIAVRIGCGERYTAKALSAAAAAGMAGCVPLDLLGGRARGWYTEDDFPGAQNAWDEIAAQRKAARKAKGLVALVGLRRGDTDSWGAYPVQRLLGARSKRPLPFTVRAPNSVFALAETAEAA